jgi:magnesium-transporting ATPase (P-type)
MSTVSIPTGDAVPSTNSYNRRLHMKGGGEKVIPACTHFLTSDGTREPITDSVASAIQTEVVNFTHKALRVIVLAYKDLD